MNEINNQNMLQVGTILHGTYKIESYLSFGRMCFFCQNSHDYNRYGIFLVNMQVFNLDLDYRLVLSKSFIKKLMK